MTMVSSILMPVGIIAVLGVIYAISIIINNHNK